MATQIISTHYGTEEFQTMMDEFISRSVTKAVKALLVQPEPNQILTRQETAKLLAISLPTLHDYTKRGIIKCHRLGTKVRYKRQDIDEALKQIRHP